jgi:hypothetical protein
MENITNQAKMHIPFVQPNSTVTNICESTIRSFCPHFCHSLYTLRHHSFGVGNTALPQKIHASPQLLLNGRRQSPFKGSDPKYCAPVKLDGIMKHS